MVNDNFFYSFVFNFCVFLIEQTNGQRQIQDYHQLLVQQQVLHSYDVERYTLDIVVIQELYWEKKTVMVIIVKVLF